jgi:hypothetical protein
VSSMISSPHVGQGIRDSPVRFPNLEGTRLCADDEPPSIIGECMEAMYLQPTGDGQEDAYRPREDASDGQLAAGGIRPTTSQEH